MIVSRGIFWLSAAAAGAAKNAAIDDGSSARPVWNASAPRTACRNIGIEKMSPDCPMRDTAVVVMPDAELPVGEELERHERRAALALDVALPQEEEREQHEADPDGDRR